MTGLELFTRDGQEIDAIHQSLAELRKISYQWGRLTDKEESRKASLLRRRQELESVMGYAAYDLRGETSRLLRGWDINVNEHWASMAREIAARYEALAKQTAGVGDE